MADNQRAVNMFGNFRNFENWMRYNDYMINFNPNAGARFVPHEYFAANIRLTNEEISIRYNREHQALPRITAEPLLKFIISDFLEHLEDKLKPPGQK